jgi:flagellar basal body-associated protein FliL
MAGFIDIDIGKGIERDLRRCLVILIVLLLLAAGAGAGIYHLFFAK